MKETFSAAYMTVEASIIIPFIMIVTILFVYKAGYVYDRTLLLQDTVYVVEKVRENYLMNKDAQAGISAIISDMKDKHPYFSASDLKVTYSKKGNRIAAVSTIKYNCPFDGFEDFIGISETIKVEKSENIKKAHSVMRKAYFFTRGSDGKKNGDKD